MAEILTDNWHLHPLIQTLLIVKTVKMLIGVFPWIHFIKYAKLHKYHSLFGAKIYQNTGSQRSSITRGEHLVRKQFRGKLWVSRNRYCHWKDKYTRIVSSLLETFLFVILLIFCNGRYKWCTNRCFRKQRLIFTDFIWSFLDVFSCSFEFSFFIDRHNNNELQVTFVQNRVLINFALPNINSICYSYLEKTPVLGWFFNFFCSFQWKGLQDF